MTIAADEEVYTLKEVAAHLKIGVARARKLNRLGRFPNAFNLGSDLGPDWRIPESDVVAIKNPNGVRR